MLTKSTLDKVKEMVAGIAETEHTYLYGKEQLIGEPLRYADFSEYGLSQAGVKLGFPYTFLQTLNNTGHPELANEILQTRARDYFEGHPQSHMIVRNFYNKHYGFLSDKYSIFDDKEVMDIVSGNEYLRNAEEVWSDVTPEQFHARFISANRLHMDGDSSDLSMAVFVDNSMVGKKSFSVRFGIYRWACTNGMITGLKQFTIVRQIHKGKEFDEFHGVVNEAMKDSRQYEDMLLHMVKDMANTKSAIYDMAEEDAVRYIKEKLFVGKRMAGNIFQMYQSYGGKSRWDLCNAITDAAHTSDMDTRLRFETLSSLVA